VFGGAAKISGSLSTDGNVTLGNSSDDTLTVTGTSTFAKAAAFSAGLSGSLTKLADGTSYLIAGTNVTIASASNGAVTISSAGSSGVSFSGGNGSNNNITTADGLGAIVAEPNLSFDGSTLNITGSIIGSNFSSSDKVLITSGSSRTISQAANLTWDSTNSYLGIAVATPGRNLNVDAGARFGSTNYVEFVAGNATSWRWSIGGSITTIEHNPRLIVPTNVGNFIGFQSQNGSDPDVGFSRPAVGILSVSGSAPGAIFRFNATSTPLSAGDLGMSTTTGRPQAFIGGAAVALAHTGEIAPIGSAYVTIGSDATLTGERALTAGTGISVTDGGANSTATIAINNSVVATISGSTFSGAISAPGITSTAGLTQSGGNVSLAGTSGNTFTVGNASTTGTAITLGQSTKSNTINIGNGITEAASAQTIQIATAGAASSAYGVAIGGASSTGTITVGQSTGTNTINIGTGQTANGLTQTINVGNSATGTGKSTITIGNTNGASSIILNTGAGSTLTLGGSLSTGSVGGSLEVTGNSVFGTVIESLLNNNNSSGVTAFSLANQSIFYVNNPAGNVTANFTNAQTTNNRIISTTVILSQSGTPRIVSAVQIDGTPSTINWANNVTPTGNANKQDIFGFSLIRSGSAWKTLGQMTTYG
jgi:hypothetical protein